MANDTNKVGGIGLPPGTKIGKYEIKERLGIGGQAIIYKAYDALLDRYVAVKQISSHLAEDPKFLEHFRKEAQILARLGAQQPAIVTIYELVEDERGLFIVMEHVPGHTLEATLNDNPQPVEVKAVLQVLWRLAAALNEVHSAGIIHRDIKPGNIMIGDGLRPKITDFGVAASLTGQTSMLLGTTKYMAPELLGNTGFDGRADMYSLGFIMYEMLVGREKFNEIFADVVRDKHSESLRWMKWHGNASVQAPAACEVNPAVPKGLSDIVAKMIAKDPAARFESMEALGRAIKTEFSPKARQAAAAAAPPKKHKHRKHVATAAGAGGAVPPVMHGDEGDELVINAGGPATAPLPKKRLTVRGKIVLASAAAMVIVIAGIVFAIVNARSENARNNEINSIFLTADKAYKNDSYADAIKNYKQVLQRYGGSDQAYKASVMIPLCESLQAVQDGNWNLAESKQDDASKARENVNRLAKANSPLYKWSVEVKADIDKCNEKRGSSRSFREAMAKAEEAVGKDHYEDALGILNNITSWPDDASKELWRKYHKQVDLKKFMASVDSLENKAMEATAAGKFDDADKLYTQAAERFATPEADVLSPDDKKARMAEIDSKRSVLNADRTQAQLTAKITQAKKDNDRKGELNAITDYLKIKPGDPAMSARATELKALIACDEALQFEAQKQYAQARDKYVESMRIQETDNAKAGLDRVDKFLQRDKLVTEGDAAVASGKYDDALAKYVEAGNVVPADDALKDKMRDCRYHLGLAEADKLRDEKKWNEALKKYEELRIINPQAQAAAELDAREADVKAASDYQMNLTAGDAALTNQQWDRAMDAFNKAKAKARAGTPEVNEIADRLAYAKYLQHVTQGKADLEQGNGPSALGHFKIAAPNARTDQQKQEIDGLISQAEEKIKNKTP